MVKYEGPNLDQDMYEQKFLRVEKDIYVTSPGDILTQHFQLARQDGIVERIAHLKIHNPSQVDGGQLIVYASTGSTLVTGMSDSVGVPTVPDARDITVEVFQRKTPAHKFFKLD